MVDELNGTNIVTLDVPLMCESDDNMVANRSLSTLPHICLPMSLLFGRVWILCIILTDNSLPSGCLMYLQPVSYSHLARSLQDLSASADQVRA